MQRQAEQTFNAAQGEMRALEDSVNTVAGPKSQSRTVEGPNGCYWQRLTLKKELGEGEARDCPWVCCSGVLPCCSSPGTCCACRSSLHSSANKELTGTPWLLAHPAARTQRALTALTA
jgi:hypothetical protein